MDELGDKLNALFADPGQLDRITRMAKSIMGGDDPRESAPEPKRDPDIFDPSMLSKLKTIMGKNDKKNDKRALLNAMKPYLSDKRRKKVDRALQLAKFASFAELAVGEFKLDDD